MDNEGFEIKCLKCGHVSKVVKIIEYKADTITLIADYDGNVTIECDCGNEVEA